MPNTPKLVEVFKEVRELLSRRENDFTWSSWEGEADAVREVDSILDQLQVGRAFDPRLLQVLFAPTGPIQEVSLSSGWGQEFIVLANRFDEALESESQCACTATPQSNLTALKELGLDDRFGEATILHCPVCHQIWLRYHYENEAFAKSGRWFLGAISPSQLAGLSATNARAALEKLDWYFFGGSYFEGKSGKSSGMIP